MRIVIAPDSFKGCLAAPDVCRAIESGLRAVSLPVETALAPMADGGEGTVRTLVEGTGGKLVACRVTDPLGERVTAEYGVLGDAATAVIEMAAASGLTLVPLEQRNPLHTTTYGTGELILHALDGGARRLIVGLGGSATTDGGIGMAAALGARFLDAQGCPVPLTGAGLLALHRIDMARLDPRVGQAQVRVACDVDNPLFGERGAAAVYGPQKGAPPETVDQLDEGLRNLARVIARDVGVDVADLPGAGAAGGLGAGLVAFCGATLEPGVEIVMEAVGLRGKLVGADLCFVAEGRLDQQTAFGKTPAGVARLAGECGVPVLALAGSVAPEARLLHERGIAALFSILNGPLSLEEAMDPERASALLALAAEEALRAFLAGRAARDGHPCPSPPPTGR